MSLSENRSCCSEEWKISQWEESPKVQMRFAMQIFEKGKLEKKSRNRIRWFENLEKRIPSVWEYTNRMQIELLVLLTRLQLMLICPGHSPVDQSNHQPRNEHLSEQWRRNADTALSASPSGPNMNGSPPIRCFVLFDVLDVDEECTCAAWRPGFGIEMWNFWLMRPPH